MSVPPAKRRGFSKRAQMVLFVGYVLAGIGVVLMLGLAFISRVDPLGYRAIRAAITDVTGIPEIPVSAFIREGRMVVPSVSEYFRAGSKNAALREELRIAQQKLIQARGTERENALLKRTLRFVEQQPEFIVSTRLIGSAVSSPRRTAMIAAGSVDGVRDSQPVLSANGLLGRVTIVGRHVSEIMLITDPQSSVPLRNLRNNNAVIAMGRGDGALVLRALIGGTTAFRKGDFLVSSGTGGLYPPNIPVAVVGETSGGAAIGWPLANPNLIDVVIVKQLYTETLPEPQAKAVAPVANPAAETAPVSPPSPAPAAAPASAVEAD